MMLKILGMHSVLFDVIRSCWRCRQQRQLLRWISLRWSINSWWSWLHPLPNTRPQVNSCFSYCYRIRKLSSVICKCMYRG